MENKDYQINEIATKYIDRIAQVCKERKPLVVISCITYNHEPYLRDALEGFVMQQTDFPFVAVVHDDASTDRTAEVLKEYANRYPDIILPIFDDKNQYSKGDGSLGKIMRRACDVTGSKYVAICEGDDYWTDPHKLQKQVDFLEANPEYGMCYAFSYIRYGVSEILKIENGNKKCKFKELLLGENGITTLTSLFRAKLYDNYNDEVVPSQHRWKMGDLPLWLYIAKHSKIKCLPEVVGVYRILEGSASHLGTLEKQMAFNQNAIDIKLFFNKYYNKDNRKIKRLINYKTIRRLIIAYNLYDPSLKPMVRKKASETDLFAIHKLIVNMCLTNTSRSLMIALIKAGYFIKHPFG